MGEVTGSGDAHALITKLTNEFRTRLDDTLIIAIISDFDLANDQQYDEVHSILSSLAQNVTAEEASVFETEQPFPNHSSEPAATAGHAANLNADLDPDPTETSQCTTDSAHLLSDSSSSTDWAYSLSDDFADLHLPKGVNVATLDEDGQVAELQLMFAGLNEVDLKLALKKAKGNFTRACEELLNLQYLEENGLRPKGIDGAFRDDSMVDYHSRSNTPKDKEKGKNRLDVDYRLTPVDLSEGDDTTTKATTSRPLVRRRSLPRIVTSTPTANKVTVSAPISPAINPTDWQTVRPKKKTYNELVTEAAASRSFANRTQEAAHAAYRRGKSDVLYRPVAGVLAERAREQRAQARLIEVQQHAAYVDRTASANSIDLHGVPVADGVRIALDRTYAWWVALGEDRARKARQDGFVVVTGLGNHSASGVSRMRQEVGAALKREGWCVRVETGQYVVTGKT
ncbi:unnamed protein product [Discula destructiva]